MKKRKAREDVFILLFESMFHDTDVAEMMQNALEFRNIEMSENTVEKARAILSKQEELDETIKKYSVNWNVNRISKVALAVLRLAVFEIEFDSDIPVSVSINEAVEISKKYATEEDAKFVNGLLGSLAKDTQVEL